MRVSAWTAAALYAIYWLLGLGVGVSLGAIEADEKINVSASLTPRTPSLGACGRGGTIPL